MPRRFFLIVSLLAITACAPSATTSAPTATVSPAPASTATDIPHADFIRFALVGDATLTNVWAYYDERGADYNNRAIQAGMWPSLYTLSPLTGDLELFLAESPFPPFEPDSGKLASSVTLRPGLLWSDSSPVTAADVAFTVNTALAFRLGLDWGAAYNPDALDHAEAVDALTVRFDFKYQPSIADWQFGALQGPIVQAAYWEPRLAGARDLLLPIPALEDEITDLRIEGVQLQNEMNDLLAQLGGLDASTRAYQDMISRINTKQEDINSVNTRIERKQDEVEVILVAAREALYALDASGEPTFGPFLPAARKDGQFVNDANPVYPFAQPNFDRAVYRVYADEQSALSALQNGEADVILSSGGVLNPEENPFPSTDAPPPTVLRNRRNNIRYLAFNLANPFLDEIVLRRAIACVAGGHFFPTTVFYLDGTVLPENSFWYDANTRPSCAGMNLPARQAEAVRLLESVGYTWDAKPAWDGAPVPGSGLRREGMQLPPLTVLVTEDDPLRVASASVIVEQLRFLGMDVQLERVAPADVLYRVFETRQYDMAILGWRLARYPAYLCDLFGTGNPYSYSSEEMSDHCAFFRAATDMEIARQEASAIQSLLAADLPVVPLYSESVYDALRGVAYPFDSALDGISGMYGAPWLAIPSGP